MSFNPMLPRITSGVSLIGIHGHAKSGKNTVCTFLGQHISDAYQEAFADPLKEAAAEMFGWPPHIFYLEETKENIISPWHVSPRQCAQFFGTEMVRDNIHKLIPMIGPNFWVARMAHLINGDLSGNWERDYAPEETVIITDVRFQNEYDWILENNGVIIHLTRPGADGSIGIPNHASEAGIIFSQKGVQYELKNDGTLEDLEEKVTQIAQSIQSQRLFNSL